MEDLIRAYEGDGKGGHKVNAFTYMRTYEAPPCPQGPVKNILVATDHANWTSGHYAAVVQMARQLNSLGYHAVLSLRLDPPKAHRPKDIEYVLNDGIIEGEGGIRGRIERYRSAIEKYDIDTVILNAWTGSYKYWDLAALQHMCPPGSSGRVRVLLQFHSSFAKPLIETGPVWHRNNGSVIHNFDALITSGDADKEFWEAYHPLVFSRPLPLPNVRPFEVENKPEGPKVIYVARFSGVKNQKAAICAFAKVVDCLPEAQLVLTGGNTHNYKQECVDLVAKLGLQDNVYIRDFVKGKDKEELFRTAACVVNTSFYESFSLYLFEAKAYGLPVVANDLPNLTLLEGGEVNGALLVPQRRDDMLADALVRVLSDAKLQAELGAAARSHARQLADFDYAAFWAEVFGSLGSQAPVPRDQVRRERMLAALFDAMDNRVLRPDRLSNDAYLLKARINELERDLKKERGKIKRIKASRAYRFAVKLRSAAKRLGLR